MNDHYWRGIRDMAYITAVLFLLAGLSQSPAEAGAFMSLAIFLSILGLFVRMLMLGIKWNDNDNGPSDRGR